MAAEGTESDADTIEREIAARIRDAKIRLRFDRVVVAVVGRVKAALATVIPEGEAVIFTLTAPIELPAKTAAALESLVRDGLPDGEHRGIVHGNGVRVRRLAGVSKHMPKVLGFVHNPASDAGLILALAEARLREPG